MGRSEPGPYLSSHFVAWTLYLHVVTEPALHKVLIHTSRPSLRCTVTSLHRCLSFKHRLWKPPAPEAISVFNLSTCSPHAQIRTISWIKLRDACCYVKFFKHKRRSHWSGFVFRLTTCASVKHWQIMTLAVCAGRFSSLTTLPLPQRHWAPLDTETFRTTASSNTYCINSFLYQLHFSFSLPPTPVSLMVHVTAVSNESKSGDGLGRLSNCLLAGSV